ncbi:MFS transporter [bacterium]|nr:MFS transporter [bacterium]
MSRSSLSGLLARWGFSAFLLTQFLGALNDNIYQMVIQLLAARWTQTQQEASGYVAAALGVFVLPFLLFSGFAGYLADVKSKRTVLIATKSLEIVAMLLAFLAFFSGSIAVMLGVLFLMATQSAFFSPAKYGILPEMLPDRDLSRANGLLEMTTFVAIVLGGALGGYLLKLWSGQLPWIGLLLVGIAVVGTAASFGIARVPASGARKRFSPLLVVSEIVAGVSRIRADRRLSFVVLGICYFFFLGALTKTEIVILGTKVMNLSDAQASLMYVWLALGIGGGSLLAGRLSGDKIELGLVPVGSLGMGLFSALLSASYQSYTWTCTCFAALGVSGGLFIVPLNAFLQQRPAREEKGRILATNNVLTTISILLAVAVVFVAGKLWGVSADRIFLYLGLFTWMGTVLVLCLLPDFFVRFVLWAATNALYRIRIEGEEHIPRRGPALLVCNHVSHVDALIVSACVQRFVRFLVYAGFYRLPALYWLFKLMRAIPISGDNPRAALRALEAARRELEAGHVVCIFAEGGITRTGNLLAFKNGLVRIARGLSVPIVPVHLDRLWGSVFSFKDGRFWWKKPERTPYPVTVTFRAAMDASAGGEEGGRELRVWGAAGAAKRRGRAATRPRRLARSARRRGGAPALLDAGGRSLSFRELVRQARAVSSALRPADGETAALALAFPLGIDGAVANAAAQYAGRVTLNLDARADSATWRRQMASAACGTLVAPHRLLAERAELERVRLLSWEEVVERAGAHRPPLSLVRRSASRLVRSPDPAAIVYAHHRDGVERGVVLSHRNILHALEGLAQVLWTTREDRLLSTLPFWQAAGLSGSLWFPLIAGLGVVLVEEGESPEVLERAARTGRPTLVLATPSQYAAMTARVAPEALASVRHFIAAGAERLDEATAEAFRARFGRGILAAYGLSEMAPIVSINAPDVEDGALRQAGGRPGSVGHPIPGVAVRIVDETGRRVPPGTPGRIQVKGPNLFLGYVNDSARAGQVIADGWLETGDLGFVDEEGFLHLTGWEILTG